MAKQKTNKSAAIREALAENPTATANEIVEILAKKGVKVLAPHVYNVRSTSGKKPANAKQTKSHVMNGNTADMIVSIKKLAREAGGFENFQKIVKALAD